MIREIQVTIDRQAWRGGVPAEIQRLAGPRSTNIDCGLLHTALRTRPPTSHGFHLSDLWAWFRYAHAIARSPDLRLRPEWSDIDQHQKAVLSDELGMGLTTQLLAEELGIISFVDTIYCIRVLAPRQLSLLASAKQGPAKSPDFIGLDGTLRLSVIECKGTQSSHSALLRAMRKGRAQKGNVQPQAKQQIHYSLVVGLFVPQAASAEHSRIHIMDPTWEELEFILSERHPDEIARSVVQIDLAKHLALMEVFSAANFFASTPTDELRRMPAPARDELRSRRRQARNERVSFERESRVTRISGHAEIDAPTRFAMAVPDELFARLDETSNLREFLDDLALSASELGWRRASQDAQPVLISPLGFDLQVLRS